jgi:chromate transporter
MIAIAESTPGVIAVNSATYVGYKVNKFWGSIIATLGVVLPSFLIICILSLFIDQFLANEIVQYAFRGIRAVVGVLILNAALKLFKKTPKNFVTLIVFLLSISLTFVFPSVSTIYFILLGFLFGIIWYAVINKPKEGGNE